MRDASDWARDRLGGEFIVNEDGEAVRVREAQSRRLLRATHDAEVFGGDREELREMYAASQRRAHNRLRLAKNQVGARSLWAFASWLAVPFPYVGFIAFMLMVVFGVGALWALYECLATRIEIKVPLEA